MSETEYLNKLIQHADETVDLLSSRRKSEREMLVCKAFLRCLGIDFLNAEISTPANDPPDAIFNESMFEVMMITNKSTLHGDWKDEARKRRTAKKLVDLAEPYTSSEAISMNAAYELIDAELSKKAKRYGHNVCSTLDALIYLNLKNRHLWPIELTEIPQSLHSQGWRSVSFIFAPYSHIVFAGLGAPKYLRDYKGLIKQDCTNPDRIFED